MNNFYVYILKCADGSYYTGSTDNLEKRLDEHYLGQCGYTASRLPINLVFSESFDSRTQAFSFERQIKGWSRIKKEALINRDFDSLVKYSKRSKTIN